MCIATTLTEAADLSARYTYKLVYIPIGAGMKPLPPQTCLYFAFM